MTHEDISAKMSLIVDEMCRILGIEPEKKVWVEESEGRIIVNVELNAENLGYIIGFHGRTLESLESVLHSMINKQVGEITVKVLLNINGYRQKREEVIRILANNAAEFVRTHKVEKHLPPMKAYDRRLVHLALKDYIDITTESVGEGEDRRVVVKYNDDQSFNK